MFLDLNWSSSHPSISSNKLILTLYLCFVHTYLAMYHVQSSSSKYLKYELLPSSLLSQGSQRNAVSLFIFYSSSFLLPHVITYIILKKWNWFTPISGLIGVERERSRIVWLQKWKRWRVSVLSLWQWRWGNVSNGQ